MRLLLLAFCSLTAASVPLALVAGTPVQAAPVGVPVRLRLETALKSGHSSVGTPVLFTVEDNVYGPGHVLVLEKGDAATGHVAASSGHRAFRKNGKLVFTCDYAATQSGVRVPLLLTVTADPPAREGEDKEVGVVVGEASIGKFSDGYGQSATPGGAYQQSGYGIGAGIDPERLVENGDDETVERGQKFEAVTAGTASEASVLGGQLFVLKNNSQITGTLVSFNGHEYSVKTAGGSRSIKSDDLVSIAPLPLPSHH